MRQLGFVLAAALVALTVASLGCKRKEAEAAKVAQVLDQSFKAADVETKQAVAASAAAIAAAETKTDVSAKSALYIQALAPMRNLVARGNLTPQQLQAAREVFTQVNKAVQSDRRLATREMYQAQNAMAQALYRAGGRR
jgi:hypothetical protein